MECLISGPCRKAWTLNGPDYVTRSDYVSWKSLKRFVRHHFLQSELFPGIISKCLKTADVLHANLKKVKCVRPQSKGPRDLLVKALHCSPLLLVLTLKVSNSYYPRWV